MSELINLQVTRAEIKLLLDVNNTMAKFLFEASENLNRSGDVNSAIESAQYCENILDLNESLRKQACKAEGMK